MKKNITCTLLAFSLICTLVSQTACGFIKWNNSEDTSLSPELADTSSHTDTSGTEAPNITEPKDTEAESVDAAKAMNDRLAALPDKDLSSSALIIATVDANTVCPNFETENADIIARSDVRRAVEEKYNAIILQNVTDAASMLTAAREAYNTDMYYADLIAIPGDQLGAFHAAGILANMNSLPFTDYTADYYNSNITAAAKLGGIQFAVSGDANFNPEYLTCIYFNRTLAAECVVEDVYSLVRNGKWTWDKLSELSLTAKSANSAVSGLGAFASSAKLVDLAAVAQGLTYVSGTGTSTPTVDYLDGTQSSRAKDIVDKIYRMIYTDGAYTKTAGNDVRTMFSSGSLLFCVDTLDCMTQISNGSVEWGILAMPKYDETDEAYISPMSTSAPIFCALGNTPSYETSGLVLEALNAAAHDYTINAYLNERIDYHLRDTQSVYMLEYILENPTLDFSHMFASGVSGLANAAYNAVVNAVTTRSTLDNLYKNNKAAANRALTAAVQIYE